MLRVTVELVPDGDEGRSRLLGRLEIVNTAGESPATGDYQLIVDEFDERIPGRLSTFRTVAALENVERDVIRPMQLIGMALNVVAPVKQTMHSWPEVPHGVVLSREAI
ncbi:hypothetical protein [Cupriavidus sp. CP313]